MPNGRLSKGRKWLIRSKEPVGLCPFSPSLRYFQKINARNINYMTVLDFLKMPKSEEKIAIIRQTPSTYLLDE